jgi:hypothetical protein
MVRSSPGSAMIRDPFASGEQRPQKPRQWLRSQKLRMLLTHRKLLQSKAIAIENDLRGILRNFGSQGGYGWDGQI